MGLPVCKNSTEVGVVCVRGSLHGTLRGRGGPGWQATDHTRGRAGSRQDGTTVVSPDPWW